MRLARNRWRSHFSGRDLLTACDGYAVHDEGREDPSIGALDLLAAG